MEIISNLFWYCFRSTFRMVLSRNGVFGSVTLILAGCWVGFLGGFVMRSGSCYWCLRFASLGCSRSCTVLKVSYRNLVVPFGGGWFATAVFISVVRSCSYLARNDHLAWCFIVTGSGRIVNMLSYWRSYSYAIPQEKWTAINFSNDCL